MEAGRSEDWCHPQQHRKLNASLGYMRPSLNKRGKYHGDFDGMMSTECPTRSVDFCLFVWQFNHSCTIDYSSAGGLCLWRGKSSVFVSGKLQWNPGPGLRVIKEQTTQKLA